MRLFVLIPALLSALISTRAQAACSTLYDNLSHPTNLPGQATNYQRVMPAANGAVTSISFWVNGTGSFGGAVGLYSSTIVDDAPDALLSSSGYVTFTAGLNTVSIPAQAVTDFQYYWVAISLDDIGASLGTQPSGSCSHTTGGYLSSFSDPYSDATLPCSGAEDIYVVLQDCNAATATVTGTHTPGPSATNSPTVTPSFTAAPTGTQTLSQTPSRTRTSTPTVTLTVTPTPTDTATPTSSPTRTMTETSTATPSFTDTPPSTLTATSTPSRTQTYTASQTYTRSPTRTGTPTSTSTPCSYIVDVAALPQAASDAGAPVAPVNGLIALAYGESNSYQGSLQSGYQLLDPAQSFKEVLRLSLTNTSSVLLAGVIWDPNISEYRVAANALIYRFDAAGNPLGSFALPGKVSSLAHFGTKLYALYSPACTSSYVSNATMYLGSFNASGSPVDTAVSITAGSCSDSYSFYDEKYVGLAVDADGVFVANGRNYSNGRVTLRIFDGSLIQQSDVLMPANFGNYSYFNGMRSTATELVFPFTAKGLKKGTWQFGDEVKVQAPAAYNSYYYYASSNSYFYQKGIVPLGSQIYYFGYRTGYYSSSSSGWTVGVAEDCGAYTTPVPTPNPTVCIKTGDYRSLGGITTTYETNGVRLSAANGLAFVGTKDGYTILDPASSFAVAGYLAVTTTGSTERGGVVYDSVNSQYLAAIGAEVRRYSSSGVYVSSVTFPGIVSQIAAYGGRSYAVYTVGNQSYYMYNYGQVRVSEFDASGNLLRSAALRSRSNSYYSASYLGLAADADGVFLVDSGSGYSDSRMPSVTVYDADLKFIRGFYMNSYNSARGVSLSGNKIWVSGYIQAFSKLDGRLLEQAASSYVNGAYGGIIEIGGSITYFFANGNDVGIITTVPCGATVQSTVDSVSAAEAFKETLKDGAKTLKVYSLAGTASVDFGEYLRKLFAKQPGAAKLATFHDLSLPIRAKVYNQAGRLAAVVSKTISVNDPAVNIDTSNFSSGVYYAVFELTIDGETTVGQPLRFMVVK